jgi:hypothetical protein
MALFINQRRCGNTIRIVDELIQDLFTKGKCVCHDHYLGDWDMMDSNKEVIVRGKKMVMRMVLKRLSMEHQLTNDELDVNNREYIITLKTNSHE